MTRTSPALAMLERCSAIWRCHLRLWLAAVALVGCTAEEVRSLDFFTEQANTGDCSVPSDCPDNRPFCESGLCLQCSSDVHCDDKKPACFRGTCVACLAASYCEPGQTCNLARMSCTLSCSEAADCAGQKESRCSLTDGYCVECASDDDCDGMKPHCEQGAGRCVECRDDEHCGDAKLCDISSSRCVSCLSDDDCESQVCDLQRNECVECRLDDDCDDGEFCDGDRCVAACTSRADCPAELVCRSELGVCSECVASSDCTLAETPHCGAGGQCVECLEDDHCLDPTRPGCVPAAGECTECTRDEHCLETQVCDLAKTRCVDE